MGTAGGSRIRWGTLIRLGGEPTIGINRLPTTPVADGTDPSRPRVYG